MSLLATKREGKIDEMGPTSLWAKGPEFLCYVRVEWPTSDCSNAELPPEELPKVKVLNYVEVQPEEVHRVIQRLREILNYSLSLRKVEGVTARFLRLSCLAKSVQGGLDSVVDRQIMANLSLPLTPKDFDVARRVLLLIMQEEVKNMLAKPPPAHKKKSREQEQLQQEKESC